MQRFIDSLLGMNRSSMLVSFWGQELASTVVGMLCESCDAYPYILSHSVRVLKTEHDGITLPFVKLSFTISGPDGGRLQKTVVGLVRVHPGCEHESQPGFPVHRLVSFLLFVFFFPFFYCLSLLFFIFSFFHFFIFHSFTHV